MKIPAFVKQLAKVCDRESSRFALGGIKCESDGTTARMTATDGRILATVHWHDDDCIELDTVADAKSLAALPAKSFSHSLGVRFDGSALRGGATGDVEQLDGRFPDCEKVMHIHDEPDGYVAVKLDAALLGKLCALSDAMNDDQHKGKGITLFVKGPESCVYAATTSEDGTHTARFAIMPLAADDGETVHQFPARPGAEKPAAESKKRSRKAAPAPVPECLDDDTIAEAVAREPEPIGAGCGLIECDPL